MATESRLTCGIALCTFNGIDYVAEQLRSLLSQGRLPDEIAIFDDASEDGTWEFIEVWARKSPVPIKIFRHPHRAGIVRNFEAATRALNTDLIFLCDQDDIWLPQKIEQIANVFEADPVVTMVHTNARLVDANASDLKLDLFRALRLSSCEHRQMALGEAFSVLCRRNIVTGATAAFRRELLSIAQPFSEEWVHDEWLAILAAATGRVVLLDAELVLYRQHQRNAIGVQGSGLFCIMKKFKKILTLPSGGFQLKRMLRGKALNERLQGGVSLSDGNREILLRFVNYTNKLSPLPNNLSSRLKIVFAEISSGSYREFSRGVRGLLRDILNR